MTFISSGKQPSLPNCSFQIIRTKLSNFHSCNQYIKDTVIPEDKTSVGSFTIVSDKLKEQLKTIITSPISAHDIEPFKNIKKLYLACMNKSKSILKFWTTFLQFFELFQP